MNSSSSHAASRSRTRRGCSRATSTRSRSARTRTRRWRRSPPSQGSRSWARSRTGPIPLQALADLQTIRERFGTLDGVRVAWVGDGATSAVRLRTPVGCSARSSPARRRPAASRRSRRSGRAGSSATRARRPRGARPRHRRLGEHGAGGTAGAAPARPRRLRPRRRAAGAGRPGRDRAPLPAGPPRRGDRRRRALRAAERRPRTRPRTGSTRRRRCSRSRSRSADPAQREHAGRGDQGTSSRPTRCGGRVGSGVTTKEPHVRLERSPDEPRTACVPGRGEHDLVGAKLTRRCGRPRVSRSSSVHPRRRRAGRRAGAGARASAPPPTGGDAAATSRREVGVGALGRRDGRLQPRGADRMQAVAAERRVAEDGDEPSHGGARSAARRAASRSP